jgi:selenide,water dikinase
VGYEAPIDEDLKTLLFDPQTSGGLLISLASEERDKLLHDMQNAGISAHHIGNVTETNKPLIRIY